MSGRVRPLRFLPLVAALLACNGSGGLESDAPQGRLAGTISVGPFCPVEVEGEECPPPPGTYESIRVVVYAGPGAGGRRISEARPDAAGRFELALPPGTYRVLLDHAFGIPGGPPATREARVEAGRTTTVAFEIDTGIR